MTDNDDLRERAKVEQMDRDAAAGYGANGIADHHFTSGAVDDHGLVQAFARHRIEHTPKANSTALLRRAREHGLVHVSNEDPQARAAYNDLLAEIDAHLSATQADGLVGELEKLHNDARGCTFDLVPADGPIARLALFMHQNGDRLIAALKQGEQSLIQGEGEKR